MLLQLMLMLCFAFTVSQHGFAVVQLIFLYGIMVGIVVVASKIEDDDEHMDFKATVLLVCIAGLGIWACNIAVYDCQGQHIPTDKSIHNHWMDYVSLVRAHIDIWGPKTDVLLKEKERTIKWPNCLARSSDEWIPCKVLEKSDALDQELSCKTN